MRTAARQQAGQGRGIDTRVAIQGARQALEVGTQVQFFLVVALGIQQGLALRLPEQDPGQDQAEEQQQAEQRPAFAQGSRSQRACRAGGCGAWVNPLSAGAR